MSADDAAARIDVALARVQHEAYVAEIRALGRSNQARPDRLSGVRGRPDHSGAGRETALGDPCAPRPGSVHAEEPALVYAFVGRASDDVGGVVEARGYLRALQRPADAALVREPARRRV